MTVRLYILLALLTSAGSAQAQSEIVITHDNEIIDPSEGITLSEISYPLIRVKLANEVVRQRYPSSEITLIRHNRAVYIARFHGSNTGEESSLRNVLSKAKSGDKLLLRLRGSTAGNSDRLITIPLN